MVPLLLKEINIKQEIIIELNNIIIQQEEQINYYKYMLELLKESINSMKTTKNTIFKKYTLVCTINSRCIVGYELYDKKGMSSDRMLEFIQSSFIENTKII
jgi:hypothetical protein